MDNASHDVITNYQLGSRPPDWLCVKSWLRIPADNESVEAENVEPPLTVTIDRVAWWARRVVRYSFLMEPSALDWLDSVS
jgi:hypothetical protein